MWGHRCCLENDNKKNLCNSVQTQSILVLLLFWKQGTCFQIGFGCVIFFLQLLKCWDYRHNCKNDVSAGHSWSCCPVACCPTLRHTSPVWLLRGPSLVTSASQYLCYEKCGLVAQAGVSLGSCWLETAPSSEWSAPAGTLLTGVSSSPSCPDARKAAHFCSHIFQRFLKSLFMNQWIFKRTKFEAGTKAFPITYVAWNIISYLSVLSLSEFSWVSGSQDLTILYSLAVAYKAM